MNAEEHGPCGRRDKTFAQRPQKEKDHARHGEEEQEGDPVVAIWIQAKPRKEDGRYGLARERPIPIGDVQTVERVKKLAPAAKSMRHVKQRVALKELREAVGKDKVLKKHEREQECGSE